MCKYDKQKKKGTKVLTNVNQQPYHEHDHNHPQHVYTYTWLHTSWSPTIVFACVCECVDTHLLACACACQCLCWFIVFWMHQCMSSPNLPRRNCNDAMVLHTLNKHLNATNPIAIWCNKKSSCSCIEQTSYWTITPTEGIVFQKLIPKFAKHKKCCCPMTMQPTPRHRPVGGQVSPPMPCAPISFPHWCPRWSHLPHLRLSQSSFGYMGQSLDLVEGMLFVAPARTWLPKLPSSSSIELPDLCCMHVHVHHIRLAQVRARNMFIPTTTPTPTTPPTQATSKTTQLNKHQKTRVG